MKKIRGILILIIPLILLVNPVFADSIPELTSAKFSSDVSIDQEYSWNVDNYQYRSERVENKNNPNSFELIHGSDISLTVLKDPSDMDLARRDSLTNSSGFSDYFSLVYDDISTDFSQASPLYIWIFPPLATATDGSSIDLLTDFWIYNVYNILTTGETLEFNSSLLEGDVTSELDGDELKINFDIADSEGVDASIAASVHKPSGVLISLSLISLDPDFRIEIDRSGTGGFLPVQPLWIIIPIIGLPLVYRKIKRKK